MKKLIFLAQLGAPGRYNPAVFADQPGGDNEIQWFEDTLRTAGIRGQVDYSGIRICYDEALPDLDAADAYVIGGSYHSVHDDLPWQRNLQSWLKAQRQRDEDVPIFGICGGHQAMATALGGHVAMLPAEPRVGTFPVSLTEAGHSHPLFDGLVPRFHFGNEEHVDIVPEGATVLATAPDIPGCALDFGRGWWSVQFHPEATKGCMIDSWGPRASEVSEHYEPTPESPRLIENFLKQHGMI